MHTRERLPVFLAVGSRGPDRLIHNNKWPRKYQIARSGIMMLIPLATVRASRNI
jgi:hypothetical protein